MQTSNISKSKRPSQFLYSKLASQFLLIGIFLCCSCHFEVRKGINKDLNTGLTSYYNGIIPQSSFITMNGAVLNHTDIPLGSSLEVVNENVKGFVENNGKVKFGCSLQIVDEMGEVLLFEPDLFEGKTEVLADDARTIKCIVNTGEPMEWERNYKVLITYWDKNGTGTLKNEVTIKSIDIP